MSKIITQLLQHKEVGREEDAGVPYDRIVEKCKEVLSKDSRYWSDEMTENLSTAPYWSANKWMDVLSKGGGQKIRFQYCLKPNCPEKLLYLRAIRGHSGKAYSGNARTNPALQDNVLLPKDFTMYFDHVGNGNELRSIVRDGLVPGGFSTKTGSHAVFLPLWTRWTMNRAQGKLFEIYRKQESSLTRILGNHFRTRKIGAIYCSCKEEDCNLTKQGPMRSSSTTHCLQSSLRKWHAWKKLKNSFTKEKAQDHVLFSRSTQARSKIILGNTTRCTKLPRNRMQHCGLKSSRHIPLNSSTARWTKTTYSCQVDREVRITLAQRTMSERYESDAEDVRR